jgi:ATP-dependent helicase/nuclease subunit A
MQFSQSHLIFNGKADLVGDDLVVDIKTEQECNPQEHRFQLWAYAHTLQKSQAYIAYLRQNLLYSFSASDLESISQEAEVLIQKIGDRVFEPTPSEAVCGICPYSTFCEESVILDSEELS